MAGIEDIFKTAQRYQSIQKSLGISSQLTEMFNTQEKTSKSFSGLNMVSEFAKSMQKHRKMFEMSAVSGFETMTKGLDFQAKFSIPKRTLDTITTINQQHVQLFDNLRSVKEALNKNQDAFNQINSWQFAISGISGQLAAIAASRRKWDLIDDFEEITEEAVSLNERVFNENGVTKEGLNELKQFFNRIEIKVDKIDKDANVLF
jgi:hypothetical protein